MRILFLLMLMALFASCDIKPRRPIVPSAEPEYFARKTDKQNVSGASFDLEFDRTDLHTLAEIFREDSITPQNKIFWLPDLEEALKTGNHNNVFLLSEIDTVMDLLISGKKHRLMVFHSDLYTDEIKCDGQVCAPWLGLALFRATKKNTWELAQFVKLHSPHGSWGKLHPFELCYYGSQYAALALKGEYMTEGHLVEIYRLVDLTHEFGKEIFRSRLYASNAKSHDEHQDGFYESINEIRWIRQKNYFGLYLIRSHQTNNNGAREIAEDTLLFRYSEDLGVFMRENKTPIP